MFKVTNWIVGAAAGLAMMATSATADTNAAQTAADSLNPEPASFSTQGSPPAWWPVYVALGLSWDLDNDHEAYGSTSYEQLLLSSDFQGLRMEFGWELALLSASSSAGSSLFGNFAPLFVLGAVVEKNTINGVRQGASTFSTNGKSKFHGFYTGLNMNLFGNANAAVASSSFAAVYWNAFANLGYGHASVDAFGGSFHRTEDGLFYEVGTEVLFSLGYMLIGPAIVFRSFDNGTIKRDDVTGEIRIRFPLN